MGESAGGVQADDQTHEGMGTYLLVQLPGNIVDRLLTEPQTLSDSVSDLSDESLHVEVLQRRPNDGVGQQGRVRQRQHQTRRNQT